MLFRSKPADLTPEKKPSMREFRLYEKRKSKPNILDVALEYRRMIDSGEVASQTDLARKLGVSRARITQVLNVLKVPDSVLSMPTYSLYRDYFTERKLRRLYSCKES